jgi:nucleotide-binding universal stress UspA family protein
MFETIVVGVDGREGGRDALALSRRLSEISEGELIALHAYPYDYFVSRGANADFETAMHRAAMETVEGELERTGVVARAVAVADGSPGRALHLAASRHHGDLIVVGSAHRGRIGRVLAGDDAAGTLHGAPCPVLVAPGGYAHRSGRLVTIGVGYDGSPESHAALALARDLGQACGARLRIIEVVMPPEPGDPFPAYGPDWSEDARLRYEDAQRRVEGVVATLGDRAIGEVAVGDAARELAFAGNTLDLLVVGSRDHGPIRRLILGSTSNRLVHEARCPVLVTARRTDDEARDAGVASAAAAES